MKNYLKSARQKSGLSQHEVAKKLGYGTAQFISNWERGISNPPISNLKAISKLYKIDFEELSTRLINQKMCELMDKLQTQIDKES